MILGTKARPWAGVGLRPLPGQAGQRPAARRVAVVVHVNILGAVVGVHILIAKAYNVWREI